MLEQLELKDIGKLEGIVGKTVFLHRHTTRQVCIPLEKGGIFIAFHYCDIRKPLKNDEHVYMCALPDKMYLVCDNKHIKELFKSIDKDTPSYSAIIALISLITERDVEGLEKLEDNITSLEDKLITGKHPDRDTGNSIVRQRNSLLKIKRYYEQLGIVTSDMLELTRDMLDPGQRAALKSLDRRLDHLLASALTLRDYTTQVREAYQAQIDIEQNQIMKIFTVITAVFLPQSLIVGWYGMNFDMPEYLWPWGYAYVTLLSIATLAICIMIFKYKRWY